MSENGKIEDIDFYLDPSLIDLDIVKRIGIRKSLNSLMIETCNQLITQTIHMNDFSSLTIRPLRKQLDEVLIGFQSDKKMQLQNSIITCINTNNEKIYEHSKETESVIIRSDQKRIDSLISLALDPENTEKLFKDQYGKPFAAVRLGNDKHLEILAINSIKFKRYLSRLNRKDTGSSISDSSLSTVITSIAAEAEFNDEVIPLHLRVSWGSEFSRCRDDCIYYDMSDTQRRIIEISKDGWRIIEKSDNNNPILFRKYNQQTQSDPDRNYPDDIFDQFINLTNVKNPKHEQLVKVYLVSTLIPDIDHVILTTYGPKGAAKSFLLELIKKLIDPSKPTLLTLHRNIDQFIQQANHNYINYYDNVKYIPFWLSDEICKAVTGIGHTKRQHYTDDEDIIYEHKRCLGLNGINVALTESDALDRSLFIELEEIDDDHRKKEVDLWNEFERIKPQVLGYILNVVVKAMRIKLTLNLKKLPRMADWTEWGEAISQVMGYPPNSFLEAYAENRNEQNIVAVYENLVGFLILKYIQDIERQFSLVKKIQFEPQELYQTVVEFAGNNEIRIDDRHFPKNASNFVKKLKTVIPNLKAGYGIFVEIGRSSDNTSIITIFRKTSVGDKNKDNLSAGGSEPSEEVNTISKVSEKTENIENIENFSTRNDTKDFSNQNSDADEIRGDDNDA